MLQLNKMQKGYENYQTNFMPVIIHVHSIVVLKFLSYGQPICMVKKVGKRSKFSFVSFSKHTTHNGDAVN